MQVMSPSEIMENITNNEPDYLSINYTIRHMMWQRDVSVEELENSMKIDPIVMNSIRKVQRTSSPNAETNQEYRQYYKQRKIHRNLKTYSEILQVLSSIPVIYTFDTTYKQRMHDIVFSDIVNESREEFLNLSGYKQKGGYLNLRSKVNKTMNREGFSYDLVPMERAYATLKERYIKNHINAIAEQLQNGLSELGLNPQGIKSAMAYIDDLLQIPQYTIQEEN